MRLQLVTAAVLLVAQVAAKADTLVYLCKNTENGTPVVELVDSYEGRILHGMTPDPTDLSGTPVEIAQQVLRRLPSGLQTRALVLEEKVKTFSENLQFSSQPLEGAPPATLLVRQRCRTLPAARYEDANLLIDEALWAQMSPLERTGLLLHEVIAEEARTEGEVDHFAVRALNSAILAGSLVSMTEKEIAAFFKETAKLPVVPVERIQHEVSLTVFGKEIRGQARLHAHARTLERDDSGALRRATLHPTWLPVLSVFNSNATLNSILVDGPVEFHPNGAVKRCTLSVFSSNLVVEQSGVLESFSYDPILKNLPRAAEFDERAILVSLGGIPAVSLQGGHP